MVSESEIWEIQTQTAKALNRLSSAWKGPVHINIGLDEPLYNKLEKTKNYARTISEIENDKHLSPDFCDEAREILPRSKVLVLFGQMENNERLLRELVLLATIQIFLYSLKILLICKTSNLFIALIVL